jgi:hypothetical protein
MRLFSISRISIAQGGWGVTTALLSAATTVTTGRRRLASLDILEAIQCAGLHYLTTCASDRTEKNTH